VCLFFVDNKLKGHLLVGFSGILFGFIIFGGQISANLGLSLFELSTLPYLFSPLLLLPFVIQKKLWVSKKHFLLLFFFGLVEVLCTVFQFAGLILGVSVAVVVLLLYAQPLWTTIISFLFLKEKINKWQIIACVLVIFGVIFLVNPVDFFSQKSWVGMIAALFGGIFLSLWVVFGSVAGKRKIHPVSTKFYVSLISLAFLFLGFPILSFLVPASAISSFSSPWPIWIWGWLFVYNLLAITLGHIIYFTGAKFIPTASSGVLLLLEPVSGVILSAIFLSQPITLSIVAGGALILLGNYLVVTRA